MILIRRGRFRDPAAGAPPSSSSYENAWSGPFTAAVQRAGVDLIAGFRVPARQAASLLDRVEAGPAVVGGVPDGDYLPPKVS